MSSVRKFGEMLKKPDEARIIVGMAGVVTVTLLLLLLEL